MPKPPRILTIIGALFILGFMLTVVEVWSGRELSKEGWAALGSVITALAMLGTRLIDKDD